MIMAPRTAGPDTQPDPEQDRFGDLMPARINTIFILVQVLSAYGLYLSKLLNHQTVWPGFTTIARFFGTVDVPEIVARIQRGLMRAAALQALLLQRAQRGRDLIVLAPLARVARKIPPDPSPDEAPDRKARRPWQPPLTLETLPSMQEIEAEVRRRPIGRTIAAICLDLAISPSLCTGPFWNHLFGAMQDYRGSLVAVTGELRRREKRFENEDWKRRHLPWPERTREGMRQALGFFIGENPFQLAPAATAGPS